MRGLIHRVAATASVGALALGFAACSDTVLTSPQQDLRAPAELSSHVLNTTTLNSSTTNTQLCGFNSGMGAVFAAGPCANSSDPGLGTYNPGWFVPLGTAVWVGPQANSSQYIVPPGTYLFQTTFTLPSNFSAPSLNLTTLADNSVRVLLNGHPVSLQTTADCNGAAHCNWQDLGQFVSTDNTASDFVVGTNTISIYLTDTFIGFPLATPAGKLGPNLCDQGPQSGAPQSLPPTGNWVISTCLNPAGLWYTGTVNFTTPDAVVPLFVIGDLQDHAVGDHINFWGSQWWKHNPVSGVADNGWQSFKGFADIVNGSCGSTWASLPGNSSKPPATIGSQIGIIVTSTVTKAGNNEGGNIVQILLVNTDPGYGPNPGHDGNGTVASIVCTAP